MLSRGLQNHEVGLGLYVVDHDLWAALSEGLDDFGALWGARLRRQLIRAPFPPPPPPAVDHDWLSVMKTRALFESGVWAISSGAMQRKIASRHLIGSP
jgi:hypothetical protein